MAETSNAKTRFALLPGHEEWGEDQRLNSCRKTSFIGWLSASGAASLCAVGGAGAAGAGSASAGSPLL